MNEQQFQAEVMDQYRLLEGQFNYLFSGGDLDSEYGAFIMANSVGDRLVCNGNDLIIAQEHGYLFYEFKKEWINERVR